MILLAGFEPFGGLSRNPSGDLALALDQGDVTGLVLPVDYARIGPRLAELLPGDWDAVVLMGVAVGRPRISLERVAINHRDAERTDNAGSTPESDEIVPGGREAYFSTLPLEALRDDLASAGLPVEISLSAGAYLCNASFYLARHLTRKIEVPCGFVHLPPTPDLACAAEPLAFEEQRRAIERILTFLRGSAR